MTKIRNPKQTNHRVLVIEICDLDIVCNLLFGAWNFISKRHDRG
jgi:hypothetical protein